MPFLISRGHQSRKRARADESDDLDLFRDLPFAEVAEVDDLEEEEPLIVSTVQRRGWSSPPAMSVMVAFNRQLYQIVWHMHSTSKTPARYCFVSKHITAFRPFISRRSAVGTDGILHYWYVVRGGHPHQARAGRGAGRIREGEGGPGDGRPGVPLPRGRRNVPKAPRLLLAAGDRRLRRRAPP